MQHQIAVESKTPVGVKTFRVVLSTKPYGYNEPIVYFYDMDYIPTVGGQFTGGSYLVESLMDWNERTDNTSLNLNGGVPAWTIDRRTMDGVIQWLVWHTVVNV